MTENKPYADREIYNYNEYKKRIGHSVESDTGPKN